MLIIFLAISIVQIAYFTLAIFVLEIAKKEHGDIVTKAEITSEVEEKWHTEAKNIKKLYR